MAGIIDLDALAAAPLLREPFDHVVVGDFVAPPMVERLVSEFPDTAATGLLPADMFRFPPRLALLARELTGAAMTGAIGAKFGIDLEPRPAMLTLRSQCQSKDGRIHTDSERKIVTALLYLNPGWRAQAGRLRLLRSRDDIDDYAVEVPPEGGTLVAFRRSGCSWHGHTRYVGVRRYLMVNWMCDERAVRLETARHRVSGLLKGAMA